MTKPFSLRKRVLSLSLFACLLQIAGPLVRAQDTKAVTNIDPKELEAFLDPIFAEDMARQHIPGAVIAIVKDGRILFSKGYGYADLDKKTPVIADKTIFRIGSITKTFTTTSLVLQAKKTR